MITEIEREICPVLRTQRTEWNASRLHAIVPVLLWASAGGCEVRGVATQHGHEGCPDDYIALERELGGGVDQAPATSANAGYGAEC